MIIESIVEAVHEGVVLALLSPVEKNVVKSFVPKQDYSVFWGCSLEHEWTFMLLVAHALGYENPETTEDSFTLKDPDLNLLVNLAVDISAGRGNMDTGLLFLSTLEQLEERLPPHDANR